MDKIGPYQILEPLYRGPRPLYRAKAADGTARCSGQAWTVQLHFVGARATR